MKPRIALLLLITAIALGCGEDEEEGKPTGATCPTASALTYDNFGAAFMDSYCLRCHSTSVTGVDREGAPQVNYSNISARMKIPFVLTACIPHP